MTRAEWHQLISVWQLPTDGPLMDRIDRMVRPALLAGYFGSSYADYVAGLRNEPDGQACTTELATLAKITSRDHLLDVGCFIGGAAIQLAATYKCHVMGVDMAPNRIAAASRIAELAGLGHLVVFRVADPGNLPFEEESFSVVWSHGLLDQYSMCLREFDRVLAMGGRMTVTLEIGNSDPATSDHRWRLGDTVQFLRRLGYSIDHMEDITQRDIGLRWKALERQLSDHKKEFAWLLGADWVRHAQAEFSRVIAELQAGEWGRGHIVATKSVLRC